ncbi:hypothetical protein H8F18_14940 [Vibrio fluvialis]|uniref:hypothetical protein n=1 Tax=Vibrio fluvialis TaxID=676 RepID=UPI00192C7958|nr:hypothetical protein [Vibrio fluvialis]MBL4243726.1 hypothetical protein [Vibrio fluvialis]MBL4252441.1 hypothetical protein [Vibrio fluvialis]BEI26461.1 hypothetical protein KKIDH5335_47930 [Vibrio fluvialis]HBK7909445.1 hypothetical protein [Vibrio cholerae]
MKNQTIQSKATQLKLDLEEGLSRRLSYNKPHLASHPVEVKLSHCHELIAATFGYGQRVSMKKDGIDWDDQEVYTERWRDTVFQNNKVDGAIIKRITELNAPSLKAAPGFIVSSIVQSTLTPPCKDCGHQDSRGRFVHDESGDDPIHYVCRECASDDEEYDTCLFCGDDILYPISLLNSSGECPIHKGESYYDEEQMEDMESYVEYINNH